MWRVLSSQAINVEEAQQEEAGGCFAAAKRSRKAALPVAFDLEPSPDYSANLPPAETNAIARAFWYHYSRSADTALLCRQQS